MKYSKKYLTDEQEVQYIPRGMILPTNLTKKGNCKSKCFMVQSHLSVLLNSQDLQYDFYDFFFKECHDHFVISNEIP